MLIRKAELDDCEVFVNLRVRMRKERDQGFDESKNDFIPNTRRFFTESIKNGAFVAFFALEDSKAVSMSGISVYSAPPTQEIPNGKVAYLMSMYTLPEYRKRGMATQLLGRAVEEAAALGCDKVTLSASAMGKPLYAKYGFMDTENDMAFFPAR